MKNSWKTALCVLHLAPNASLAQIGSAQDYYQSRYLLSGFFLRAGYVCEADAKQMIQTALELIATDELKRLADAFPKLTEKWSTEGANNFNTQVMKTGLSSACNYAVSTLKKAGH